MNEIIFQCSQQGMVQNMSLEQAGYKQMIQEIYNMFPTEIYKLF